MVHASTNDPIPAEAIGHISSKTVTRSFLAVALCGGSLLLVYFLRGPLILFMLGFFLATVIEPGVAFLERFKIPRGLGILLHFAAFIGMATFLFFSILPIIGEQLASLSTFSTAGIQTFLDHPTLHLPFLSEAANLQFSTLLHTTLRSLSIEKLPQALSNLGSSLSTYETSSLQFATGIAGSFIGFFMNASVVLLFAFFIALEREFLLSWFCSLFPERHRAYTYRKARLIQEKLAQWAKGQLMLCIVIGILTFIVLLCLGMPYAVTLALLSGFTEFIPYVGPLIAAVPAILIAGVHGGIGWAFVLLFAYYAVQWTENNVVVPLIMRHAVNLSPVAIICAMLVSVSFPSVIHPILGILLSIPTTAVISIFLDDLRAHPMPTR